MKVKGEITEESKNCIVTLTLGNSSLLLNKVLQGITDSSDECESE